jgi:hypothetical protein
MLEVTITSPYIHSRVDTFTMGNPMPKSTLLPLTGTVDLASGKPVVYEQ